MESFKQLPLAAPILRALDDMGFKVPTPIQAQAIPTALQNRDLVGLAPAGTGKSSSYCVPIVSRLNRVNNRMALVLVPSSKIAAQLEAVLSGLTRHIPELEFVLLVDGASLQVQLKKLDRNPRILVATPGRLIDHLQQGSISLSRTDILVLDEAERMLDQGLAPQLNQILRFLPKARQTMVFAAALSSEADKVISKYLKDPARVTIAPVAKAAAEPLKKDSQSAPIGARKGPVLSYGRIKRVAPEAAATRAKPAARTSSTRARRPSRSSNSLLAH